MSSDRKKHIIRWWTQQAGELSNVHALIIFLANPLINRIE